MSVACVLQLEFQSTNMICENKEAWWFFFQLLNYFFCWFACRLWNIYFLKNTQQLYPPITTQGDRFACCEDIVSAPWFRPLYSNEVLHHSPAPPLQSKLGRLFFPAGSLSWGTKLLGGDASAIPQEDCRRLYIFNVCNMKNYLSGLWING